MSVRDTATGGGREKLYPASGEDARLDVLWREVERLRELAGKMYTGAGGGGLSGNEVRQQAHQQMLDRLNEIDCIVRGVLPS